MKCSRFLLSVETFTGRSGVALATSGCQISKFVGCEKFLIISVAFRRHLLRERGHRSQHPIIYLIHYSYHHEV